MRTLIVGGASGLGLELAKIFRQERNEVIIMDRTDPQEPELKFIRLSIDHDTSFIPRLSVAVFNNAPFNMVVYAPGFYQEGPISDLCDEDIMKMVNVGFLGAAMLMQRIFRRQNMLNCFVAITSTSQFTPRPKEPIHTSVKAALGMFANSLSLDWRIEKTLVVAPAGMKTQFWKDTDKDTSNMLEPAWVADRIREMLNTKFTYLDARILREPPRVEVMQKQQH